MASPANAYNQPGGGRWYRHPLTGETWPSITNTIGTCVSKPALPPAAAKETAKAAWQRLPEMVAASRRPAVMDELTREIKGHYQALWSQSADLGTRVHARLEAHALGVDAPDDPEIEPFVQQALRFFDDFGVDVEKDVEATEATVVNREHGYAGTGDLWVWLKINRKRSLWVLDFKTSKSSPVDAVYPEYGLQTAAIARGEKVLLRDGTEVDPPGPIDNIGILNLRANDYALVPMPVVGSVDDAFAAFCSLIVPARYLHGCYGAKPLPVAKPKLKVA